MNEYDIEKAFRAVEDELIASMMRNMKRHRLEEISEGKEWSMWQAEQLKALEQYKRNNQKIFSGRFSDINGSITGLLQQAREEGNMQQEIQILNAIKNGWKPIKALTGSAKTMATFFRLNDRKLEALIKATTADMKRAETAILRMANDQYRQVIFNAQVYANTGAGTYEKAVDMASKDFLNRGLNCVEYTNGARHTLADYAFMAIQTAAKRAYLAGEGEKRKEWGISTVIMNKRGNACPKCLPFVGKVLIDDVWSGGAPDGKHMLMSTAISKGLYHPRCKDSHTTYFPGISSEGASYTKEDLRQIEDSYRKDQKRQYAKRQTEKFTRLANNSIDKDSQIKYRLKVEEWKYRKKLIENGHKDDIIKAKKELLRIPQIPSSSISKKIDAGVYSTKLSIQQYNKHITGTKQYKDYFNTRAAKGGNPQSILSISADEVQAIINKKAGTGIVEVTRNGDARNVENISHNKVIGKHFAKGEYHDTKKAAIHYGKNGAHIVPIRGDNYD